MSGTKHFPDMPCVRLVYKKRGWQIQERDDESSTEWYDVKDGWFYSPTEAEEAIPYLC